MTEKESIFLMCSDIFMKVPVIAKKSIFEELTAKIGDMTDDELAQNCIGEDIDVPMLKKYIDEFYYNMSRIGRMPDRVRVTGVKRDIIYDAIQETGSVNSAILSEHIIQKLKTTRGKKCSWYLQSWGATEENYIYVVRECLFNIKFAGAAIKKFPDNCDPNKIDLRDIFGVDDKW